MSQLDLLRTTHRLLPSTVMQCNACSMRFNNYVLLGDDAKFELLLGYVNGFILTVFVAI